MRERSDFARLLVQVAPADVLKEKVTLRDPSGKLYHQRIWYEWRSWTCDHCVKFGHVSARCKCTTQPAIDQPVNTCTEVAETAIPPGSDGVAAQLKPAVQTEECGGKKVACNPNSGGAANSEVREIGRAHV